MDGEGHEDNISHGAGIKTHLEEGAKPQTGAKPNSPAVKPPTIGPTGPAGNSGAAQ
jgi:hypothetical protein